MSHEAPAPTRTRRPSTVLWIVILILLLPPIVIPLWVPLYDRTDPTLWGFPFFYWFQFALILFSAAMTVIAFSLSLLAERKDAASPKADR